MKRSRLATKLLLASLPIGLVALLAGGYIAWTFLNEAIVQDQTARSSTVASQAMATLRTMWSEEHLANTFILRPDQVDPGNLESVQVELDSAVARLESSVNTLWRQAGTASRDMADRVVADTQALRSWLNDVRANDTITAAEVKTYQGAGDYLLDIIGQTSLNLQDRIKGRELVAAEALAEAALVSFQQEQLVRRYIAPQSTLSLDVVEEALNTREIAFQNWTRRAADSSPAAAQELADLAAMEEVVSGQAASGTLEVNSFPTDRNELLIVAAERLANQVSEAADTDATRARTQASILGGSVAIILMAAGYASIRIGRSLVRRVRTVTEAARKVAEVDLPNLVDALRNPQEQLNTEALAPMSDGGPDEVGELANSFSALHGTLIDVARQQMEILRKGVSEIFVTLARRNRALVDRQLALIDQLENREEDPEILGGYYKLDHLATRMRRNAESLLVLAGTETPRLWAKPLEIGDVVRAALGEVDEYQRIDVLALEPVRVAGSVVADIAHLLSELLDNATQFSPPTDRVRIAGLFDQDGYMLTVSDRGVGMTDARLGELNRLLVQPPVLGLALDPTLGLYVVSRLATRHGISVKLVSGVPGVTVRILVPRSLLETSTPARPDEAPRSYIATAAGAASQGGIQETPQETRPPIVIRDNGIPQSPHRTQPRPGHEREPVSARTAQGLPVRPGGKSLVGAEAEASATATSRPPSERADRPPLQRFATERPGQPAPAPGQHMASPVSSGTPAPPSSAAPSPTSSPPPSSSGNPTPPIGPAPSFASRPASPPSPTPPTSAGPPKSPFPPTTSIPPAPPRPADPRPTSTGPSPTGPSSTGPTSTSASPTGLPTTSPSPTWPSSSGPTSTPPAPPPPPAGPTAFQRSLFPSSTPTTGPAPTSTPTPPVPRPTSPPAPPSEAIKVEPKRYDPSEGLPTRVPGTSFNEAPVPQDTTSKSEIGPEGIKSALEKYRTGKESADRGHEAADQRQRDPQDQAGQNPAAPSNGSTNSPQDPSEP